MTYVSRNYPARLDLLLKDEDFKRLQEEFMKFLESSDTVREAILKFRESMLLPIAVGYNTELEDCEKTIDDYYFFLLVRWNANLG